LGGLRAQRVEVVWYHARAHDSRRPSYARETVRHVERVGLLRIGGGGRVLEGQADSVAVVVLVGVLQDQGEAAYLLFDLTLQCEVVSGGGAEVEGVVLGVVVSAGWGFVEAATWV